MCSRYELNASGGHLKERFGVDVPSIPNKAEVRPTDLGLIIGAATAVVLPWGLKSSWGGGPLINARCETLHEKTSFKGLLSQRVLVPACHWWEWTRDKLDKPDIKMRLFPTGDDLFAFAGLTDGERFTIVTCDAVDQMMSMNDRMPVILSRDDEPLWLDNSKPFDLAKGCLKPFAGALSIMADPDETPQLSLF